MYQDSHRCCPFGYLYILVGFHPRYKSYPVFPTNYIHIQLFSGDGFATRNFRLNPQFPSFRRPRQVQATFSSLDRIIKSGGTDTGSLSTPVLTFMKT